MAAIAGFIAENLAAGLISGIAGKVGALIFDEVFPPDVPSYFDQVYDRIKEIVHQELAQNTVNEVDGEINGLKNWVKNTYTPRRENHLIPKQDLFDLLSPKEGDLTIQAIGILQQQNYAEPGLSVFMIAAGMHLAILQELAYVDPDAHKPQKSSYIQSIKKYAQEYADHAIETFDSIEKKRIAMVHGLDLKINAVPVIPDSPPIPFGPGNQTFVTYSWKDDLTGEERSYGTSFSGGAWAPCSQDQLEEQAKQGMQEHIENVKTKLTSDLYDPKGTAAKWRKLIEQPLKP